MYEITEFALKLQEIKKNATIYDILALASDNMTEGDIVALCLACRDFGRQEVKVEARKQLESALYWIEEQLESALYWIEAR